MNRDAADRITRAAMRRAAVRSLGPTLAGVAASAAWHRYRGRRWLNSDSAASLITGPMLSALPEYTKQRRRLEAEAGVTPVLPSPGVYGAAAATAAFATTFAARAAFRDRPLLRLRDVLGAAAVGAATGMAVHAESTRPPDESEGPEELDGLDVEPDEPGPRLRAV
jgi:hypothetical protein